MTTMSFASFPLNTRGPAKYYAIARLKIVTEAFETEEIRDGKDDTDDDAMKYSEKYNRKTHTANHQHGINCMAK